MKVVNGIRDLMSNMRGQDVGEFELSSLMTTEDQNKLIFQINRSKQIYLEESNTEGIPATIRVRWIQKGLKKEEKTSKKSDLQIGLW